MRTAEYVSRWHVDKIADQISDKIVDFCLLQDPKSRVAIETMVGHNEIHLIGEITSKAELTKQTYEIIVMQVLNDLSLYKKNNEPLVYLNIVKQSPDIANGVDKGGAGDQGVMVGYACRENDAYIPQELFLARDLLDNFQTDAKAQITLDDSKNPISVVLSVQGKSRTRLQFYVNEWLYNCPDVNKMAKGFRAYCNNTGAFEIGGWDADTGVTGRKLVIDSYGPNIPIGGGAFSGKDPSKVDRSGAYMARWIALQELNKGASEVLVKLAYVIGGVEPVMQSAIIDGKLVSLNYDCRPQAIIERFDLLRPIYYDTARYGHFGRGINSWDRAETTPPPQKTG